MKRILILALGFHLFSCNNLLEESAETFISPETFYSNIDEVTAALYSAYDVLPTMYNGQHMTAFADVSSNNFKVTSASATDYQPFDIHSLSPANSRLTNFWQVSYAGINRVNAIIDRTPAISGDADEKSGIIAEAKFLRGFFYFNLVRLFGDVPLVLEETTSLENLKVGRTPVATVYEQIVADLLEAKNSLPPLPEEEGRASSLSASGLLARVYLTVNDFPKASQHAREVIDSGEHALWETYGEAFLEANDNGKESVFAVQYERFVDGNNLPQWSLSPQLNNYLDGSPVYDLMEVTDELLDSYEPGDQRKDLNAVSTYQAYDGKTITFQPMSFKYADGVFYTSSKAGSYNNTGNSGVNYPLLRYADILLMFAEAENEVSGPTPEVYEALNMVRRRAFGVDIHSPSAHDLSGLSKDDFREAVWLERFRELPFEATQWFDLIRTGRAESVLGITKEQTLYPIPQRERDINNLLGQNPGYTGA